MNTSLERKVNREFSLEFVEGVTVFLSQSLSIHAK